MDPLANSPFGPLTFITAPALLTNAACLLALSTTNRMLRTREQMAHLLEQAKSPSILAGESAHFLILAERTELQAGLMLKSLFAIYVALGCFAGATLISLIGVTVATALGAWLPLLCAALGLTLGATGVAELITCCVRMMQATKLSLLNIHEEATIIRGQIAAYRLAHAKPASEKDVKP